MKKQKGFVLAFSLLISSIVLALAFGIFNILLKQIVLTSTAANSQVSFYAADAGAECALYWDTHNSRDKVSNPNAFDVNDEYLYDYKGAFHLDDGYPDMKIVAPNTYVAQASFSCGESNVTLDPSNGTMILFKERDGTGNINEVSRMATVFQFDIEGKCAKVSVGKMYDQLFQTVIQSLGYNVPCIEVPSGGRKVVERAIQVKY